MRQMIDAVPHTSEAEDAADKTAPALLISSEKAVTALQSIAFSDFAHCHPSWAHISLEL